MHGFFVLFKIGLFSNLKGNISAGACQGLVLEILKLSIHKLLYFNKLRSNLKGSAFLTGVNAYGIL